MLFAVEGTAGCASPGSSRAAEDTLDDKLERSAGALCGAVPVAPGLGELLSGVLAGSVGTAWRRAPPVRAVLGVDVGRDAQVDRAATGFQRRNPRRRRAAGSTMVEKGECTSPSGRGVRTDVFVSMCDSSHTTSDHRTCGRSLSQRVAQHSVSDTAYRAAFVPCVRPVATAVSAARSQTSVWRSNNSCWLEHGHPGCGGTKTSSTCTGSRVGRSPAGNDCAPALSHSPRGTSEDLHGLAGVRDVSLPGDPCSWIRLGSTWLSEGDSRGVNVSRMFDPMVPGPGCRRRTQIGWEVLRLAGGGGSGFWFWGRALARFDLLSELKDAVTWVREKRSFHCLGH